MTCTATQLVKIAAAEIGTTEYPANSNKVKYNTGYYGRTVSGSAYPGCAVFVSWCIKQAGGYDYLNGLSNKAYCPSFTDGAKKKGYWLGRTTNPQPGDLVIFARNGVACHIGIVEKKISNSRVQTIEGNTSSSSNDNGGAVMRRYRDYGSATTSAGHILGFIRLPFKASTTSTTTKTPTTTTPTKTTSTSKSYKGVITAKSGLNVRKSNSTSAAILTAIPYNTTVTITEEKSGGGKTTYGGKTGGVSLQYIKKK